MSLLQRGCLVFLVCLPALSWTQQNPAPAVAPALFQAASPSAPESGKKKGPISLDVVVTDKAGAPISGLELKDFTLLDNDQPGKILSFQAFGGARKKPTRRLKSFCSSTQ